MKKKPKLVTQYLENIGRRALMQHGDIVRRFVGRRPGVYALYRRGKLQYAGLASNLRGRLKAHLKDRHSDSWDSFSVYLTIGDLHLAELESLILRVVKPPNNLQLGKFSGAENLVRRFRREIFDKQNADLDQLLGRIRKEKRAARKSTRLHATSKGRVVRARLLKSGQVRWKGKVYTSPSAAATAVRGFPTNGKLYWKYQRSPGDWVPLAEMAE